MADHDELERVVTMDWNAQPVLLNLKMVVLQAIGERGLKLCAPVAHSSHHDHQFQSIMTSRSKTKSNRFLLSLRRTF